MNTPSSIDSRPPAGARFLPSLLRTGAGLAFLASLPACDSKTEPAGESLDGGGYGCTTQAELLAGTGTVSALGFSAQELLDRIEGRHVSPMFWAAPTDDGPVRVRFSPTPGPAELSAELRYTGGEVRLVRAQPDHGDGYGNEQGGFAEEGCPDYLEVDVQLELSTDDGALAETLPATVRSWDPRFGKIELDLPLDELNGSFAVEELQPSGAELHGPHVSLGVSSLGLSGGLSAGIQLEADGWVGFGGVSVASWPSEDESCSGSEAAAAPDGAFGEFSALDALARVEAIETATLTWGGGEASPFTIGAEHGGDPVCFSAIPWSDGEAVGQMHTRVRFSARADDGSIDGDFEVELRAEPDATGALGDVRVEIYAPYGTTIEPDAFLERYGITGVDLSGYDRAGLSFSGVFSADGSASGALTVLGVIAHSCDGRPANEGCEGDDIRELAMASWSGAATSDG